MRSGSSRSSARGGSTVSPSATARRHSSRSASSSPSPCALALLLSLPPVAFGADGRAAARRLRDRVPARFRGLERLGGPDAADPRPDALPASRSARSRWRSPPGSCSAAGSSTRAGRLHPERVFVRLATPGTPSGRLSSSGLAGESDPDLGAGRSTSAALGAQFALDYGSTAIRQWATLGVPPRLHLRTMGSVYVIDARARAGRARRRLREHAVPGRRPARPAARRAARGLRARAARPHRPRARAARRLPRHGVPARRRRRGRRRVHGGAQPRRRRADARGRRRARACPRPSGATQSSPRCSTTSARFGSRTRSSTSPASSPPRSGRSSSSTRSRASRCCSGSAACSATSAGSSAPATSGGTASGYPDGIAGEEIPLIARIVACCDAYNAMTSDRSYRKALPVSEAVAELRGGSGSQFDPRGRRCAARVRRARRHSRLAASGRVRAWFRRRRSGRRNTAWSPTSRAGSCSTRGTAAGGITGRSVSSATSRASGLSGSSASTSTSSSRVRFWGGTTGRTPRRHSSWWPEPAS